MRVLGLALGVLLLIGCISDDVAPRPNPISAVPAPSENTEPVITPTPSASLVAAVEADPALVASMECEPLSDELLEQMRFRYGMPSRSIQVKVGEGNTPGDIWWVVVLDSPPDDAYEWGIRRYLTNAPGGGEGWISIGDDEESGLSHGDVSEGIWKRVAWDTERLLRAQSALSKALQCLEITP